jgi:MFS family permease
MFPAAYKDLLRNRSVHLPVAGAAIGRLPIGSEPLAVLFLIQDATGSFAAAGAVEACFSVGAAVGLPLQGRLADRIGQTRVLVPAAVVNAAALVTLVLVAHANASVATLALVGALGGVSFPSLSTCMRSLWGTVVENRDQLQTAYALDAAVIELAFIVGPLLAAVVAATVSPSAAVLAGGLLTATGTGMFAASRASRSWRPVAAARHWAGPLRAPGIWVLAAASIGFGFANGALVLALTAFGEDHGATEIVGLLIAIQAVASMIGGIWYGTRKWESPPWERYPRLILMLAIGFAPLALVSSVELMGLLMVFAGFAIAPATAVEYLLIDGLAPRGTSTEAQGWVITATVLGSAMGSVVGGAIVNGGHVSLGFVAAFGGVAAAWVCSALGRPALRPVAEAA